MSLFHSPDQDPDYGRNLLRRERDQPADASTDDPDLIATTLLICSRLSALVGLPMAQPYESAASWLCRAALSQGSPPLEFMKYLGWPLAEDVDLAFGKLFPSEFQSKSHPLAGLEFGRRVMARLDFGWMTQKEDRLLRDGGRPCYRYCPLCLAEPEPYFRQPWRFVSWRFCPDHDCLMEDACGNCGLRPVIPFNMGAAGPEKRGVAYLNQCKGCGVSLSKTEPISLLAARGAGLSFWDFALLHNGRAVQASLFHKKLQIVGVPGQWRNYSIKKQIWDGWIPTADVPPSTDEIRKRLREKGAEDVKR